MTNILRACHITIVLRRYQAILLGCSLLLATTVIPSSVDSSIRIQRTLPFPVLTQPVASGPMIALTFDDGPHSGKTENLLAVLKHEQVPATFFVVGKMAARYPQLIRDIAAEGHELANHTYTHPTLSNLSDREVLEELDQTRAVVRRLTGRDTVLFRPPGGDFTRRVVRITGRAGYRMVLWTVLVPDVRGATPVAMQRRILRHINNGGIVLMHSGMPNTIAMLPTVIHELKSRGYRFVTVSDLMQHAPTTPTQRSNVPPLQTASFKKY
jgi:peptidoglycan-N-acetylglucosamine deacetylase